MSTPDLEAAVQEFRHKQRRASLTLLVVVIIVLTATISILAYLRYRSWQTETRLEAQNSELKQLAAEAHMRWDMRTERPLNRAEILEHVTGDAQKKVMATAIDLYEQKPPIPYTWGGKSPQTGFDSSGYVAYTLAQAGVITNPSVYWSGHLRQHLKQVSIENKQPGDVVFYPGGVCMFYLGGPDDLSLGALPGGIASGKLDHFEKPEAAGRY